MAAKGSQSKKGATRKAAPAKHPTKKKVKWWLWLFVLCLAGAFIFGLAQLSQVQAPTSQKLTIQKPADTVKPKKVEPKKAEPKQAEPKISKQTAPKKDNFEFYQILQDSEVDTSHVDAYQSTPRGKQDFLYMIQAASFRSNNDADRMRAKLILSGLEASVRQTTGKDGRPWFRVVLGPYESRSKMSRAQDKLVSLDIQSYTYKVKKDE
ncbi:SPOR domain-containing protein [Marinomonas sp. 15G1-11]|uniref:SPOR domain-containing protein n=1 Tax=Marinomonas phaeophyticola TaxID=3004091 RepID=A0ABT4JSA7_9GAMM|nr:SPOR domain-containing protein [Marinomonas sp. 15G1-11]MCZ2721266.1 SPOR domain-containing protein [Marinomonas sp. 15G1-11]